MNRTTALVATVLLALLSLTVGAQVYRWVDKDGKVQYSDQPPPPGAGKAEATRITSSTPSSGASAAPTAPPKAAPGKAEPGKAPAKGKAEPENAAKAEAEARQKRETAEFCQNARGEIRQLQDGYRLSVTSPEGEVRFIEDDERAARIARLQKQVAETCK